MLGLRKPYCKTKIIPFEKSHNAENCKRRPFRFFNIHSVAKFQKIEGRPDPLESFGKKSFEKKTKKWEIFNAEKSEKGTFGTFNIRSVAKYQNKLKGGPFKDIKKFSKKSLSDPKRGEVSVPKKLRTFCFRILVRKLAHTHGFEHETFGLKSKHPTTRPRTPELCDLRAETRELSPGKKAPTLPLNTCLSQV